MSESNAGMLPFADPPKVGEQLSRTFGASNPCPAGCGCGRHTRNSGPTKRCTKCGEQKVAAEFYVSYTNAKGRDILHSRCKTCCRLYARDYQRVRNYARVYGITVEEYDALLARQGGVCAICEKPERAPRIQTTRMLSVDHDHVTGRVRGLLCSACNRAIGLFGDDVDILMKATRYMRQGAEQSV